MKTKELGGISAGEFPVEESPAVQQIKHVIRVVSRDNTPKNGAWPMRDVEDWIQREYLNAGWKLFDFSYLGEVPEGYTILWVLTK